MIGALAHLLGNPIYVGKVTHTGAVYEGQHAAIIDEQLWEQVQAKLADQRNGDNPVRSPKRSLLVGLIYDGEDRKMTPTHTSKSGKRYRYYVTHQNGMVGTGAPAAWRVSAPELERVVVDRLQHWLLDRRAMVELAGTNAAASAIETAQRQATALADPLARMVLVAKLISRIDIMQDAITVSIASAAAEAMLGLASDESASGKASADAWREKHGQRYRAKLVAEGKCK